MNYDYALYCRGFVFADKQINSPKTDWKQYNFNINNKQYYLWYDIQNEISLKKHEDTWCFMLGMVMDTIDWHMDLDLVCKNCLDKLCKSKNDFYDYIDNLNGRFIIIFGDKNETIILNDATATRSVYYHDTKCLIASHYEIIAEIANEENHSYFDEFNKIEKYKPWTLPGDLTPYNNIKILIANHEWNISNLKLRRFYPRGNHKIYSVKEISSNCTQREL